METHADMLRRIAELRDLLSPQDCWGLDRAADYIDSLEKQIAEMTARAEKAEAIVVKLPRTADGVVVEPKMCVWFNYTDGSGACNDFAPDMEMLDGPWDLYYSTKEAALAAQQDGET